MLRGQWGNCSKKQPGQLWWGQLGATLALAGGNPGRAPWRGLPWKGPAGRGTTAHLWPSFIEKDDEASGQIAGQPSRGNPGTLAGATPEQPWRGVLEIGGNPDPGNPCETNPAGGNPGGGNPGGGNPVGATWWGQPC